MLHKIVTACLLLLGLVIAGLGVASGTVWRPSDSVTLRTQAQGAATLLRTDPGVLGLVDDAVSVRATAGTDDTVVLVVGHPVDIDGWIGEDDAIVVTGASDWETLDSSVEQTEPGADATPAPSDEPDATEGADDAAADEPAAEEVPAPDPSGSDMWVTETSGTGSVTLDWDASSDEEVLLVASVGDAPEPPVLELTWTRVVTTPWLWPGVVVGSLLVLAGLVLGTLWFVRGRRQQTAAASDVTVGRARTDGSDARAAEAGRPAPPASPTATGATSPAPPISAAALAAMPRAAQAAAASRGTAGPVADRTTAAPAASNASDGAPGHPAPAATPATQGPPLTRRQLREQAEQERIAREEAERAAKRSKRSWPRTGTIPVVRASEPVDPPEVPVQPEADPNRRAWLPDGTASSSGGGWRQAWGVRPVAGTDDDTRRPSGTTPDSDSRPEGGQ